jgi:hypothetical protein
MSITIAQGASLLNGLTGQPYRELTANLTQAQVDGLADWVTNNLAPDNLFTPEALATYIDGNVPDPLDVYTAETLNTAGWTHA